MPKAVGKRQSRFLATVAAVAKETAGKVLLVRASRTEDPLRKEERKDRTGMKTSSDALVTSRKDRTGMKTKGSERSKKMSKTKMSKKLSYTIYILCLSVLVSTVFVSSKNALCFRRGADGVRLYGAQVDDEEEKVPPHVIKDASSNKCHASSNRCLTSSNKKLLGTSASLLVTGALLVVTEVAW